VNNIGFNQIVYDAGTEIDGTLTGTLTATDRVLYTVPFVGLYCFTLFLRTTAASSAYAVITIQTSTGTDVRVDRVAFTAVSTYACLNCTMMQACAAGYQLTLRTNVSTALDGDSIDGSYFTATQVRDK